MSHMSLIFELLRVEMNFKSVHGPHGYGAVNTSSLVRREHQLATFNCLEDAWVQPPSPWSRISMVDAKGFPPLPLVLAAVGAADTRLLTSAT